MIEPAEPIDKIEPAEPIDKIEPTEPIDKIEPDDPMDSSDRAEPIESRDLPSDPMSALSQQRRFDATPRLTAATLTYHQLASLQKPYSGRRNDGG